MRKFFKTGPMQKDHEAKIVKLALAKTLEAELLQAVEYCKATLPLSEWMKPSGTSSAQSLTLTEVQAKLAKMSAKDSGQVVFGGCLGMLDLDYRINPTSSMDLGRMRWAATILDKAGKFAKLGPVVVRAGIPLQRLERDADLDMMLLSIYWHGQGLADGTDHPLKHMCQDIVFHAEQVASGLDSEIERFKRMAEEQLKKDVMGRSSWRLSLDMVEIVKLSAIDRQHGQSDADLLAASLAKKNPS